MKKISANLWEQKWSWNHRFKLHEAALAKVIGAKVTPWRYDSYRINKPVPQSLELISENRQLTQKIVRQQLRQLKQATPRHQYSTSTLSRRKRQQVQINSANQKIFKRVITARTTIAKAGPNYAPAPRKLLIQANHSNKTLPVKQPIQKIQFQHTKVMQNGKECYILIKDSVECVCIYAFCEMDDSNNFREKFVTRIPTNKFFAILDQSFSGSIAALASCVQVSADGQLTLALSPKKSQIPHSSESKTRTLVTTANTNNQRRAKRMVMQPEQDRHLLSRQSQQRNSIFSRQLRKRGQDLDTIRLIESSDSLPWRQKDSLLERDRLQVTANRRRREGSDTSSLSQVFQQMLS